LHWGNLRATPCFRSILGKIHQFTYSELEAVVLTPFLHHLHKVLHLGVIRVLEQLDHLDQALLVFLTCYHHLEHSDSGSSFALPELGIWVKSF